MELLIVIAIISIIAGLLLSAGVAMRDSTKTRLARSILGGVSGLSGQYEVQTKYRLEHLATRSGLIDWGSLKNYNNPDPNYQGNSGNLTGGFNTDASEHADLYSVGSSDPNYNDYQNNIVSMESANLFIERFVWAAYKVPAIRGTIDSFGDQFGDIDEDGFLDFVDPWGNPIAYASDVVHDGYSPEDDFLPQHAEPFFASAGPDGLWGEPRTRSQFTTESDYNNYKDTNEYKFSVDNLYSFDLDHTAGSKED